MTHGSRPRFLRSAALGVTTLAALALPAAGIATSASAAPLRPESFSIFLSTFDTHGTVNAHGAVHGTGTIATPAAGLAVLKLNHPYGTVNVKHTPEPALRVNKRECTAEVTQNGTWQFAGGTGADRHATGWGHFKLTQFEVLKRGHHGVCEVKAAPVYSQVSVTASGVAAR